MKAALINEEVIYLQKNDNLTDENYICIRDVIRANNAVGYIGGYYDDQLTIAHVSEYFLYDFGYTYEEFMEKTRGSLKRLFYGKNRTFLDAEHFRQIQGYGEGDIVTKTDDLLRIRFYKLDTADKDGRQMWMLSARIDWTQQNLNLVNRVIDSGFWYIDCDAKGEIELVSFSQQFRKMLGYEDSVTFPNVLSSWSKLIHPKEKKATVEALLEALADRTGSKKFDAEYRLAMPDGSYQWFKSVGEIMRRVDGTASRMAGIFVNIDEEKKQQIKEQTMNQLIEGMARLVDRYAICDLEHGTYQYFDQLNTDTLYEPEGEYDEFVSRLNSYYNMISGDMEIKEAFDMEYLRQILKSETSIYRFEYCTKDESSFKTMAITPIAWEQGEIVKILCFSQDITQEKNQEIASRKALKEAYQAAEQANQAKTEFLSNMSHDIRTPMNAIMGMTAIAEMHLDDSNRIRSCLEHIQKSSKHLLGLINEVLDMSRVESGKISLSEEAFELQDLMDELASVIKGNMEMHHHAFEIQRDNIRHESVLGDSLRIQQVVLNILNNAVKYTPDGGHIKLKLSEIPTRSAEIGCYKFVIEDNGIGISKEFQKVLFEPFTRSEDVRVSRIQGTGLGTAIAKNIVSMMNGTIEVESELGKGSRFTITIFLKIQKKNREQTKALETEPVLSEKDDLESCDFVGKRILLVEDNELNLEIACEIIGMTGVTIETAVNGKEAVEKFMANSGDYYDLILMDIQMPVLNGYEAAKQIRQYESLTGTHIPIVAMTANAFAEDVVAAKNAGMNEHLAKPLEVHRVVKALKKYCN